MRRIEFSLALLLLSGCTVADDPTNIPERGHWQTSLKLAALTIDDRSITAAEVPFSVPPNREVDKGCFEPRFKTADELNAITALETHRCHVDSLDRDGGSITAHGKCQPVGKGSLTITGGFGLSVEERSDRIKALATSDFSVHMPDGQTVRVHNAYTVVWTRLGPC